MLLRTYLYQQTFQQKQTPPSKFHQSIHRPSTGLLTPIFCQKARPHHNMSQSITGPLLRKLYGAGVILTVLLVVTFHGCQRSTNSSSSSSSSSSSFRSIAASMTTTSPPSSSLEVDSSSANRRRSPLREEVSATEMSKAGRTHPIDVVDTAAAAAAAAGAIPLENDQVVDRDRKLAYHPSYVRWYGDHHGGYHYHGDWWYHYDHYDAPAMSPFASPVSSPSYLSPAVSPAYYYDDDAPTDDDDYEDFTWVYTPTKPDNIVPITGGSGGRNERTLEQVRFNKVPPVLDGYAKTTWQYAPSRDYNKGVHKFIFPLMPSDYPIGVDKDKEIILRRETMADSVIVHGDFQLYGATSASYLEKLQKHGPHYPSNDPNAPYWDELRHVIRVQQGRRNGDDPLIYSRWPDLWADYDMTAIAKAVQNEYPGSHQQQLIESFFKSGIETDYGLMPFRSAVDFIGTQLRMAALNTWATEAVGPINFLLKWTVGMPRPEEMAWLIGSGAFTAEDGVPQDVFDSLRSMNLEHAAEFTAYEDGSPMHPSWPAMHAAASVCSFWMPAMIKLTPEQYCEALRVDYAVAYARTVAGVHYPMDNFAGLNIGIEIIKEKLPGHMQDNYGCDAEKMKTKLELLAFDWETFDPYTCTVAGVPVSERPGFTWEW